MTGKLHGREAALVLVTERGDVAKDRIFVVFGRDRVSGHEMMTRKLGHDSAQQWKPPHVD